MTVGTQLEIKYIAAKLVSASYWLGRASEALDNEDYEGSMSCIKFFKNSYNGLLRAAALDSNKVFADSIGDLGIMYNEMLDILREVI